jgi:FixJ family two-component response regulator
MIETALTIAVVDDDEGVRVALQQLLRAAGFDARGFASAEQFLAEHEAPATDCLILDVNLPGLSGVALARVLVAQGRGMAAVFISARDDATTLGLLRSAGRSPFLRKPFGDDELLEAISRAMREHVAD